MRRTQMNSLQTLNSVIGHSSKSSAMTRTESPIRRRLSLNAATCIHHTHHPMLKSIQPKQLLCPSATTLMYQTRQLRGTSSGFSGGGGNGGARGPDSSKGGINVLQCPSCGGPVAPLNTVNRDPIQYLECESCHQLVQSPANLHDEMNAGAHDTSMTIPIPKQIDEYLQRHVIGQDQATRALSVHVYNHFKRTLHYPRPVQGANAPKAGQQQQQQPTQQPYNAHTHYSLYDRGLVKPVVHLSDENNVFTPLGIHTRNKSHTRIGAFTVNSLLSEAQQQQSQPPARASHQQRFNITKETKIEVGKSNILMLGPSGSGKTLLAKTIAEALDVPFTICDCNTLTAAGYVGEDVDTVIDRLLVNADHDVERAQRGIVFLDEIDKISGTTDSHMFTDRRDVGGTAVQQAFLRMIEGCMVEVGGRSRRSAGAGQEVVRVDTTNILFIGSGAFAGMPKHIRRRIASKSVGFDVSNTQRSHDDPFDLQRTLAGLTDKEREIVENDRLLDQVTADDLCSFGMIPEFVGRFPALISFHTISESVLLRILTEPENSIIDQYKQLLKHDGVELQFTDCALKAMAAKALASGTGARSLRSVLESTLHDVMYDVPGSDIGTVIIDAQAVTGEGSYRSLVRSGVGADDDDWRADAQAAVTQ